MENDPDFNVSPSYLRYLEQRRAAWRRFNIIALVVAVALIAAGAYLAHSVLT